jgi:hypothetical protein
MEDSEELALQRLRALRPQDVTACSYVHHQYLGDPVVRSRIRLT